MSRRPIDRSPELKKLRDEGFDIEVADGYLLMHDVPYVNEKREVKRGILMAALNLTNDIAQPPSDHQAKWAGDCPCNEDGSIMQGLGPTPSPMVIAKHQVKWNFSCKPKPADKYDDFHHKMSQYAIKISGPAVAIEPAMTAQTFKPRQPDPDDSVFLYEDTASSRAEIVAMNDKLKPLRIGIVGLGGTGSYVLDFVAKTPVKEIHLFDGDTFDQHNAFRAPGAASGEELEQRLKKVAFHARTYGKLRRGIVEHPNPMGPDTLQELGGSRLCVSLHGGHGQEANRREAGGSRRSLRGRGDGNHHERRPPARPNPHHYKHADETEPCLREEPYRLQDG